LKNNLDNFVSGLISFFISVNVTSQFTTNQVAMIIIALITSGIVVIDFGNNFYITKARELIFALGICTFIFSMGIGYYIYHGALPNDDLAIYNAQVSGNVAIQVYVVASIITIILLQMYHAILATRTIKKSTET